MSIYRIWIPGEKGYKEHLDRVFIGRDQVAAVKEQTSDLKKSFQQQTAAYTDQTQKLIASNVQIISVLDRGFSRLAEINEMGFSQVTNAIKDLHSDLLFCSASVIQELEFHSELLIDIIGTLKTPERTKVIELYNEGCLQAKGGLLNYAIGYLKESITNKTGHTFFPAHYKLGLLYLMGEGDCIDIINPQEANNYLLKANELGTALWKIDNSFASMLATCKLFLSQSYYYQLKGTNSSHDSDLLKNAIQYCEESISLNPNLSQGFYHLAKYYAYGISKFNNFQDKKTEEKIVLNFRRAVEQDRNYLFSVDSRNLIYYDKAFENKKKILQNLIVRLTNEKRDSAKYKLDKVKNIIERLKIKNISQYEEFLIEFNKLFKLFQKAEEDFRTETYFGFDDSLNTLIKLENL
ncbi:MAG: hypothetical protein U0U46_03255 [Saprospiraceae bacterium]